MSKCPNKNHPAFIDAANVLGENVTYSLYEASNDTLVDEHPLYEEFVNAYGIENGIKKIADRVLNQGKVNYTLKSINLLSSDKAIQVFEKGEKNNWSLDKILTELQIPKEQKQIILDKYKNNNILNQLIFQDGTLNSNKLLEKFVDDSFAGKLIDLLNKKGLFKNISEIKLKENNSSALGYYTPEGYLEVDAPVSHQQRTVLHEALHSVTNIKIEEYFKLFPNKNIGNNIYTEVPSYGNINLTKQDINNLDSLVSIFQKVLDSNLKFNEDPNIAISNNNYGLDNLHEFLSEALSNPYFVEQLKTLPSINNKRSNLFKDFIENILSFLNINKNISIYDDIVNNFEDLFLTKKTTKNNSKTNLREDIITSLLAENAVVTDVTNIQYSENKTSYINSKLENTGSNLREKDVETPKQKSLTPEQNKSIENLKSIEPAYADYSNEQIQSFIESKIPDSQAKQVLFHGGTLIKDEKFKDNYTGSKGIYFTGSKKRAESYIKAKGSTEYSNNSKIYATLLDIKSPLNKKVWSKWKFNADTINDKEFKQIQDNNADSIIDKDFFSKIGLTNYNTQYIVFEPSQITILNSPETIQEFKEFINAKSEKNQNKKILLDNFDENNKTNQDKVNYTLKSINLLSSDKAIEIFEKGEKNNWSLDKILTELQIPKEQKQIILDKYKDKIAGKKLSIVAERRKLATDKDLENSQLIKDIRVDKSQPKELKPNGYDNNLAAIMLYGMKMSELEDKGLPEEMQEANVLAYRILNNFMFNINEITEFMDVMTPQYANVLTTNENPVKEFFENDVFEESDKINLNLREDIITSLLADNSFVVEVNVAKENDKLGKQPHPMEGERSFTVNGDIYTLNSDVEPDGEGGISNFTTAYKNDKEITIEEYLKGKKLASDKGINTSYYSNLTVPGGTNYTENEISTPDIIPNIKGHAQFSTNNGIGWFRSDDKSSIITKEIETTEKYDPEYDEQGFYSKTQKEEITSFFVEYKEAKEKGVYIKSENGYKLGDFLYKEFDLAFEGIKYVKYLYKGELKDTKIRRILEVQSDLFQKGRDKKDLISNIEDETFRKLADNQFLQLLNKKGNWVNFFIQSIVQDSVKKGYKKVLFPTGETAAKVEGHETIAEELLKLENEIINKKQRLKEIGNKTTEYIIADPFEGEEVYNNKEEAEKVAKRKGLKVHIGSVIDNNLEEELEILEKNKNNLKTQGIEKLKPVEAFYTNRVTNILNKLYDVTQITDEHSNTWNEVDITKKENQSNDIFLDNFDDSPIKPEIKLHNMEGYLANNISFNSDSINLNAIESLEVKNVTAFIVAQVNTYLEKNKLKISDEKLKEQVIKIIKSKLNVDNFTAEQRNFVENKWIAGLERDNSYLWGQIKNISNSKYGKVLTEFNEEFALDVNTKDFDDSKRFKESTLKGEQDLKNKINQIIKTPKEQSYSGFDVYFDFRQIAGKLHRHLQNTNNKNFINNFSDLILIDKSYEKILNKVNEDENFKIKLANFTNVEYIQPNLDIITVNSKGITSYKTEDETKGQQPGIKLANSWINEYKKIVTIRDLQKENFLDEITDIEKEFKQHLIAEDYNNAAKTLVELFANININITKNDLSKFIKINPELIISEYLSQQFDTYKAFKDYAISYEGGDTKTTYPNINKLFSPLNNFAVDMSIVSSEEKELRYADVNQNMSSAVVSNYHLRRFFNTLKGDNGKAFLVESLLEKGIQHSNWLISGKIIIPQSDKTEIIFDSNGIPVIFDINKEVVNIMIDQPLAGSVNKFTRQGKTYEDFVEKDSMILQFVKYVTNKEKLTTKTTGMSIINMNTPSEGKGFDLTVPITTVIPNMVNELERIEKINQPKVVKKIDQRGLPIERIFSIDEQKEAALKYLFIETETIDNKVVEKRNSPILQAFMNIALQEIERIQEANEDFGDILDGKTTDRTLDIPKMQMFYDYKTKTTVKKDGTKITTLIKGNKFKFNTLSYLNDFLIKEDVDINKLTKQDIIINGVYTKLGKMLRYEIIKNIANKSLNASKQYTKLYPELKSLNKNIDIFKNDAAEFVLNYEITQNELSNFVTGKLGEFKSGVDFIKRNKKTTTLGKPQNVENENEHYVSLNLKDIIVVSPNFNIPIEITDAQSVITLGLFEEKSKRRGALTPKRKEAIENIKNGIKTTEQLNQLKNFHTSYRFDKKINGKGLNRRVSKQVKNSELVVHSSMFPGTQFGEFMKYIEELEEKIGKKIQINVSSGQKHGTFKEVDIVDKDGNLDLNDITKELLETSLDNKYYSDETEQLSYEAEEKNHDNNIGSQLHKVLLTNLSNDAVYEIGNKKLTGPEVQKLIGELRSIDVENAAKEVVKDLEDENGNVTELSLASFLRNHGLKQDWANNILDMLQEDKERGQTLLPFYFSSVNTKIQQALTSLFTNNVLKEKFNGSHKFQFANFLTDKKPITESEIKEEDSFNSITWINGKVEELTSTILDGESRLHAKVLLPFTMKEFMTSDVKNLDKKALQMLGYRIPTEGKYSVYSFEVVGFLPEALGSAVVLPNDWIALSGSDFDIDSLYIVSYYLDNEGKVIEYLDDTNSTVEERFYKVNKPKQFEKSKKLVELLENKNKTTEELLTQIREELEVNFNFKDLNNKEIIKLLKIESTKRVTTIAEAKQELQKAEDNNNNLEAVSISKTIKNQTETLNYLNDLKNFFFENSKDISQETNNLFEKEIKISNAQKFEEFKKLPISKQNTKFARKNLVLESYQEIILNPNSHAEIKERSSFDSIKQSTTRLENLLKSKNKEELHPYDFFDQLKTTSLVLAGKKLKGMAVQLKSTTDIANAVGGITLSKPLQIKLSKNRIKEVGIKNIKKVFGNSFNETTRILTLSTIGKTTTGSNVNIDNIFITGLTSQTTAYTLDIVKEGGIPGVTTDTLTTFVLPAMLGLENYDFSIMLLNQPIIKYYLTLEDNEKGHFNTGNYASNSLYRDYNNLINRAKNPESKFDKYIKKEDRIKLLELNTVPDIEELEKNITIQKQGAKKTLSNAKYIEYLENQIALFNYFLSVQDISKDIANLNEVLSYDKIGGGPTLNTTVNQTYKVVDIEGKFSINGIDLVEAIFGENSVYPMLKTFKEQVNDTSYNLFKDFFITEGDTVVSEIVSTVNGKDNQEALKKYIVNVFLIGRPSSPTYFGELENDMISKRRILNPKNKENISAFDYQYVNITDLSQKNFEVFQSLTTSNKLDLIKNQISKLISETQLFDGINFNPEIRLKYDKLNLDLDSDVDILIEEYKKALNSSNPFVKNLAYELIGYEYLTTGLEFGKGLAKIIPAEVFRQKQSVVGNLDINGTLRDIHNKLKNKTYPDLFDVLDGFLRSNYSNDTLVPTLSREIKDNIKKGVEKDTIFNLDDLPIKIQKNTIFKYVNKDQETTELYKKFTNENDVFFREVNKLEKFEKGDESYYKPNNTVNTADTFMDNFQESLLHNNNEAVREALVKQFEAANYSKITGELEHFTKEFFHRSIKQDFTKLTERELYLSIYGNIKKKPLLQDIVMVENIQINKLPLSDLAKLAKRFEDKLDLSDIDLVSLPVYKKIEELDTEGLYRGLLQIYLYNQEKSIFLKDKLDKLNIDENTLNNPSSKKEATKILDELKRFVESYKDFENLKFYKQEEDTNKLNILQQKINTVIGKIQDQKNQIENLDANRDIKFTQLLVELYKKNSTQDIGKNDEEVKNFVINSLKQLHDISFFAEKGDTIFDSGQAFISILGKEIRTNMAEGNITQLDLLKEWNTIYKKIGKIENILETKEVTDVKGTRTINTGKWDITKTDAIGKEVTAFFVKLQKLAIEVSPDGSIAQGYLPSIPNLKGDSLDTFIKNSLSYYDDISLNNKNNVKDSLGTKFSNITLPFDTLIVKKKSITYRKQEKDESIGEYNSSVIHDVFITTGKTFNSVKDIRTYNKLVADRNKKLKSDLHGENIDYNMAEIIPIFIEKITQTKSKADNVDLARLLVNEVKSRKNIKKSRHESYLNLAAKRFSTKAEDTVDGKNAKIVEQLDWMLDNTFYDDKNRSGNDATKYGRVLRNYTSLLGMGFNVFSGLNNIIYGRMQTAFKALGKDDYSHKHWRKAGKLYYRDGALGSYIADAGRKDQKVTSKQSGIFNLFNILNNQTEVPEHGKIDLTAEEDKNSMKAIVKNNFSVQILNNIGEHALQNKLLIAMLLSHKIVDNRAVSFKQFINNKLTKVEGTIEEKKKIIENNKSVEKKALEEFEKLDSVYSLFEFNKEEGYINWDKSKLTKKAFGELREKILRKNHDLHGIYNQEDLSVIHAYEIGRLVMMFRKWMRPGWNKRFGSHFLKEGGYRELAQTEDKGTYTSLYEFGTSAYRENNFSQNREEFNTLAAVSALVRDHILFVKNAGFHYNSLSYNDRARVKESTIELVTWFTSIGLFAALKGWGEDDEELKEAYLYNMGVYQLDRLSVELGTYTPIYGWFNEGLKLSASPSANSNTVLKLIKLIQAGANLSDFEIDPTDVYRGGKYKEELKVKIKAMQLVPFATQYMRIKYLKENNKAFALM